MSRLSLHDSPPLMAGSEVLVSFLDGDPDRPVLYPGGLDSGGRRNMASKKPPPGNSDVRLLFDWLLNPPDTTP
ncbi:hypothetical protein SRABI112_05115 [Pseudomonas mediterranea]|nr:hypothetical protein SRABI112_05115 [Pseudomonas mediterranea]